MLVEAEPIVPFVEEALIEAEPLAPELEASVVPEPETPVVVAVDALIPVLEEVLVVLRVLLQFARKIARGSTKNVFFITGLFIISTPHQNSAKNVRKC